MAIDFNEAISEARKRRDNAIERHMAGKCWSVHFVVTQFRNRVSVLREDKAKGEVAFTTRQDGFGTVNTEVRV